MTRLSDRMLLTSELFSNVGIRHAFTTRRGGVSQGDFHEANYGRGLGDDEDAVARNHAGLRKALDVERLFEVHQVHGSEIVRVDGSEAEADLRKRDGDALITEVSGFAIAVRTADCLPLLLANLDSGAVAAVHCGWRSVVAGIVPRVVEAMGGRLIAAIGPHIRASSFEVGEDVAERLAACSPDVSVSTPKGAGKWWVDLSAIVRSQLKGVQIDDVGGDTLSEPSRFFSHRRDGARSGRMLSVIVCPQ